jgi:hypothetical protein
MSSDNEPMCLKCPFDESEITNLLILEEKNQKENKDQLVLNKLLDSYTVT